MELFTQLYYCGGLALGVAFLGLALRIAKVIGKREDANVAAWRQIHQERMQREARLAELKELEEK